MMHRYPLFAAGLLLTTLLAACGPSTGSKTTSSVAISTTKATRRTFHDSVSAWGSVQAGADRMRHLSLAHGGLVRDLPVTTGQAVHKGQVLLRLVTDPAALDAYRRAEHALTRARSQYRHTRQLASQHLATQSQLDTARQALADAEAAMQAQHALGAGKAVRSLRAPVDGVVTALHVGRGDRVAANTRLLDLAPDGGRIARLGVMPDRADGIRSGMPVKIRAVYGDRDAGMGSVATLGHAIDPATGLVPVQVNLPKRLAAALPSGSPVRGAIRTRQYKAWAVPRKSVLNDSKGAYLFQARQGHAHRVDVKVLQPDGDTIGVEGKLDAGLPVIVMGAYELSDGDAVRKAEP